MGGPVREGDAVVASGRNDGFALAVSSLGSDRSHTAIPLGIVEHVFESPTGQLVALVLMGSNRLARVRHHSAPSKSSPAQQLGCASEQESRDETASLPQGKRESWDMCDAESVLIT